MGDFEIQVSLYMYMLLKCIWKHSKIVYNGAKVIWKLVRIYVPTMIKCLKSDERDVLRMGKM